MEHDMARLILADKDLRVSGENLFENSRTLDIDRFNRDGSFGDLTLTFSHSGEREKGISIISLYRFQACSTDEPDS